MADETTTSEVDALAASLIGEPAAVEPTGEQPKPNGDAAPADAEPSQEAPAPDGVRGKFDSVLAKLGAKPPTQPAAAPEADRIAALEAKIAELEGRGQAPRGRDTDSVRQAMIAAVRGKDPSIAEEDAAADADVLLTMLQAAMPQLQQASSLSDSDRQLLSTVLQYAQRTSWTNADSELTQEFGDEWPDLKAALGQLHKSMGEPEWMESVPVLTILGHGLRAMTGQTAAQAAAAGKRDAVRQARRQAETTRGADVGSGQDTTDALFKYLGDPKLMQRRY